MALYGRHSGGQRLEKGTPLTSGRICLVSVRSENAIRTKRKLTNHSMSCNMNQLHVNEIIEITSFIVESYASALRCASHASGLGKALGKFSLFLLRRPKIISDI